MPIKKIQRLNRLLPLVAIGTIADCQSIIDPTNRLITKAGIQILSNNSHQIEGLSELMSQTGLEKQVNSKGFYISSQDLAFTLSPILNSSGRMTHAYKSIAALLSTRTYAELPFLSDKHTINGEVKTFVEDLIQTNQERKNEVKQILEQVELQAMEQVNEKQPLIWIEANNISKGIIGLIASRLVNRYNLPTIIITANQ
jgi:single-stranded-DNA-specific exonuclease